MEGIWSGLCLQKLGDQLLEGQAYGRNSASGGKQIQRKSVPSGVYMPMYPIVSADHSMVFWTKQEMYEGWFLLSIPVGS